MTEVIVLGLDGMGFEAVRDYDITDLKQEKFGKVTSEGIDLITPSIWSSFLCGVKDTGVYDFPHDDSTKMRAARDHDKSLFEELENSDRDDPHCWGGIGNRRDELDVQPWIEKYNFETVNFPLYDYNNYFDGIGDYSLYWAARTLDAKITPREFVKKLSKGTRNVIERTYQKISDDNEVILSYIHDTDYICHIVYIHHKMKKPVLAFWTMVSNQIRRMKQEIDEDITLLLLSDHGSSIGEVPYSGKGGHSPNGFYSFNRDMEVPRSIHITEFQEIIEEALD